MSPRPQLERPAPPRAEILRRAQSAIGQGTIYALGKGGRNPLALFPGDAENRCDCSGFAAWACGLDRYQPRSSLYRTFNGGWISTDAIVHDALAPWTSTGWFTALPAPLPGDLVVYGDWWETRTVGGKRVRKKRQGHVGVVSAFDPVTFWDGLLVIDCSLSSYRQTGDAIRERSGTFFRTRGAIFARFLP